MTLSTYNEALLDMATQSLAELARTAEQKAGKRTPAQESHFLCTWMADSLKEKRFSRLVMEDLKAWVQLGRTLGAGANTIDVPDFNYQVTQGLGNARDVNDPNFSYAVTKGLGTASMLDENKYGRAADTLTTGTVVDEGGPLGAISSYMNPYLSNSLDPTIREIQEESERQRRSIGASATMSGAFGDGRHGIMEGENFEKTNQAVSDATYRANKDAYDNAMALRSSDRGRMDTMAVNDAALTEAAQGRKLTAGQSNQSMEENALRRQLEGDMATGKFSQAGAEMSLDAQKANQASDNNALGRQLEGDMATGRFGQAGAQMTLEEALANMRAQENATERFGTAATGIQGLGQGQYDMMTDVNDSLWNAGTLAYNQEEKQRQTTQAFQEALANNDLNTAMLLLQTLSGAPKPTTTTTESDTGLWGLIGAALSGGLDLLK